MTPMGMIRAQILQAVAELPDRTSPANRPDMMLVSESELAHILEASLGDDPRNDFDFPEGEAKYRQYCAEIEPDLDAASDREDLHLTVRMLEAWAPDALPANEHGQVHFARAMLDSAARSLRQALKQLSPAEEQPE